MRDKSWITPYGGNTPAVHPDAYVDISARIIGDVIIEGGASIWPMSVLRADSARIQIGSGAAVLDLALVEAPEGRPVTVEQDAIVSHGAVVHGAHIKSRALVGIGAIVLDGALVSSGSIVAAGSLVPPRVEIPPNSLVLGVPGKVIRETTAEDRRIVMDQLEELHKKAEQYRRLDGQPGK